jgi:NAD(P)H-dependent flavin oxidoreductase YrpB (nitropropane dioxygenase family)
VRTRISDLLGVEFPILAFTHCRDVVAAVTNAGGFGVLGAVGHTPEQLEVDLTWISEHTKGRPYGIDLLLPQKYAGSDEGGLDRDTIRHLLPGEQQQFVDDILRRYQVPALPEGTARVGGAGMTISPQGYEPLLDVAFSHPIKLIASALGPPPPSLITRAHEQGVLVAALAGNRVHATRHQAAGADLIVAQGTEAGGHTGEIATMVLVPEVVDAVAPTPVLAAGGIATGRQIAAAMALGAEGVWCGSVWLTTEEAETHPVVKQKFLSAQSSDTVRSRSLTGKPARMLRTAWTDEWDQADAPAPLPMPLQSALVAEAQVRIRRSAGTPGSGAEKLANYFVGQIVGRLDRVRPARQVVLDMATEYAEVVQRFADQASSSLA